MSEQNISLQIITFLKENPGSKARNISNAIGADKKEINKLLYSDLKSQCSQDSSYRWYLKEDIKKLPSVAVEQNVNTPLSKLCNYFLSCIAEDTGTKVKVFAESKYGLDYKELEILPSTDSISEIFESTEVQHFLDEARRDKLKVLYFGYPVFLSHARSSKSNWEGYFVNPIFLFPIKTQDGGISIDLNFPSINRGVLEHFTDMKGEELIKELPFIVIQ
jgi:hypothetical protein